MSSLDSVKLWKSRVEKTSNMYLLGTNCPHLHFKSWYDFPILAAMSTRLGGVSQNEFSSMNLSFTRGDKRENVIQNFSIISKAIGFDLSNLVFGKQEHTTNVKYVSKKDLIDFNIEDSKFENTDGFITDDSEVVLATSHADCVPIYIFDDKNKTIALLHAGWKGSLGNILSNALNLITDSRSNIKVAIGASISQKNYEVGEDVADKFRKIYEKDNLPKILEPVADKFLLNLWEVNRLNALYAGIDAKNIVVSDICTYENNELLFSHRYTKGKRGNMLAFMKLDM